MDESEIFRKRPGTTDKGKDYETMVIASVVLHLLTNDKIKNFQISSNDNDFDDFDDVVIKLESDAGIAIKALQLKHSGRKTLSPENLKSKKGDFSIQKYFESFKKIKNAADEFILFTNRNFDFENKAGFQLEGEEFYVRPAKIEVPNNGLGISKNVNYVYKFEILENEQTSQSVDKICDYRLFFDRLYLYTNQDNFHALKRSTCQRFKSTYSSDEETFHRFVKVICEWNLEEGKKEKVGKKWVQLMIALQLLSSHIEPVCVGSVNDKMKILREAISRFGSTRFGKKSARIVTQLWGDVPNEDVDLTQLNKIRKLYQLGNDYIDVGDIHNLDPKLLAQLFWLMNKSPLIINESGNVDQALHLCTNKKIILLGEGPRQEFQNLSDLKNKVESYEKVMHNFTISLQGKKELNLVTVFGRNDDFLEKVTTDDLIEMTNGPLYIDGKKESLSESYIDRYLSRNIIDIKYIETVDESTIIILNCEDNFDKVKSKFNNWTLIRIFDHEDIFEKSDVGNKVYLTSNNHSHHQFQKIYNENTNCRNFHYFKISGDGNLEWVLSKGDVSDLRRFKLSNYFANENTLWSAKPENPINLITGDPGMGKSELMKSLKNKSLPKYWTVIIHPKDVNLFFTTSTTLFEKFIVDEKSGSVRTLDQDIFKMCLKQKTIIFVWDALDEVFSEYLDTVSTIILRLSKNGFIQWVTSRRHLTTYLEKQFSVLSLSISKFDHHEQQHYIEHRLAPFVSHEEIQTTSEKIKSTFEVIKHVDILGIPLQIFMLTELFRRDKNKYLKLLNNTFLLTDLYHYFIQETFNIFYENKMGFDLRNPYLMSRIRNEQEKTLKYYEKLAFRLIFPGFILQRLNIDCKKLVGKISKNFASVGLITEIQNNVPRFLHVSFAEYLVASYFSKNVEDIPRDVFFFQRYNNVRFFFDMLLAKESPAHVAVLYRNFDLLKTYSDDILCVKDAGGRSAFHLICSWGQRHPRVKVTQDNGRYILDENSSFNGKSEVEEYLDALIFLQTEDNTSEYDLLLEMTPLSYARKSESLGAELKLLDNQTSKLCHHYHRINVLYYSALLGYDLTHLPIFQNLDPSETNFATRDDGNTPLLLACQRGHTKTVQHLLKSGAVINLPNNHGFTPLYVASLNGHQTIVNHLVQAGAGINCPDNAGYTPLQVASQHGHEATVRYLVTSGADINLAEKDGRTPLYLAARNSHEDILRYLVDCGATTNCANCDGVTPLYLVSRNGYEKSVEWLVGAGAEVNRARQDGVTPLFVACCNGHEKIVEFLVGAGADVNLANGEGVTPLGVAAGKGHGRIVEYLVGVGAKFDSSVT
ncbi:uncharacterized protein LOC135122939 [Zophobas morio]|uniref:uncharacterized protein LOC135122939 n=1 Tax=Zophobas morio TaxID=2755281 RepID=UPI003082B3C5